MANTELENLVKTLIEAQKNYDKLLLKLNNNFQNIVSEISNVDNEISDLGKNINVLEKDLIESDNIINKKIENQQKNVFDLKSQVTDIEYIITNLKSQTVGVLQNLNETIKGYDKKLKKLEFAYEINKGALDFHSIFYDTKLSLLENKVDQLESENKVLSTTINKLLDDNNKQFQTVFEILQNLDNSTPGK
ncbi:hypothetical protein ma437 [Moumouvirus australiensis]|uniref:Uncharacterized protein n=1 Tax=Moumouvirus australiensis TaxID=2109587 RepID=A0A2P1ELR3_9VIRU|nr:hypothetical protein QKC55_gp468 [Moumouvirus australiensis]AVL94823.1 hypothetical protein ma437 [Moumouvirus australiensis]